MNQLTLLLLQRDGAHGPVTAVARSKLSFGPETCNGTSRDHGTPGRAKPSYWYRLQARQGLTMDTPSAPVPGPSSSVYMTTCTGRNQGRPVFSRLASARVHTDA